MSVTALIAGKLIADPETRDGTGGKQFTTAKVAAASEGEDAVVSVIAFGHVGEQLRALAKGDTVAITGKAQVRTWQGREGETRAGLAITANALITAYQMRARRDAMRRSAAGSDDAGAGDH